MAVAARTARPSRPSRAPIAAEPAEAAPPAPPARPPRRRSARVTAPVALGSLTQAGARPGEPCRACGSERVTRLAMTLTDGTPVEFTSCHRCEHRSWLAAGAVLDRASVLDKTRKVG